MLMILKFCMVTEMSIKGAFVTYVLAVIKCSVGNAVIVFSHVHRTLTAGDHARSLGSLMGHYVARALAEAVCAGFAAFIVIITLCVLNMDSVGRFTTPLVMNVVYNKCASMYVANTL